MKRKKQELIQEMVKDGACCVGCSKNFNIEDCLKDYDPTDCTIAIHVAEWFYDMGFRRSPKYMRKKYGGDEK